MSETLQNYVKIQCHRWVSLEVEIARPSRIRSLFSIVPFLESVGIPGFPNVPLLESLYVSLGSPLFPFWNSWGPYCSCLKSPGIPRIPIGRSRAKDPALEGGIDALHCYYRCQLPARFHIRHCLVHVQHIASKQDKRDTLEVRETCYVITNREA